MIVYVIVHVYGDPFSPFSFRVLQFLRATLFSSRKQIGKFVLSKKWPSFLFSRV